MLVKESITDVLKPKSLQDIQKDISSMSIEEKEDLIKNQLLVNTHDPLEFLDEYFEKEKRKIWNIMIIVEKDLIASSDFYSGDIIVNKKWLMENLDDDTLLDLYLESLDENQVDNLLNFVSKEFAGMNESIQDTLKPKSQKEIDDEILSYKKLIYSIYLKIKNE